MKQERSFQRVCNSVLPQTGRLAIALLLGLMLAQGRALAQASTCSANTTVNVDPTSPNSGVIIGLAETSPESVACINFTNAPWGAGSIGTIPWFDPDGSYSDLLSFYNTGNWSTTCFSSDSDSGTPGPTCFVDPTGKQFYTVQEGIDGADWETGVWGPNGAYLGDLSACSDGDGSFAYNCTITINGATLGYSDWLAWTPVPEPATLTLFGTAMLFGTGLLRRRFSGRREQS